MRRARLIFSLLPLVLFTALLSGCSSIGDKAASMSMIYGITATLSLLLLVGYCSFVKKRDIWHLLLFASVMVVNMGYFSLSISQSLEEALLANRLSYLGSVFLPFAMFMIILNTTRVAYRRWLPALLLILGAVVFLIAASPGYLPIYYQEVSLAFVNGVTVLEKVYGPLHGLYLLYLLGYFSAMVAAILQAFIRKKISTVVHAVILAAAVFVNIGVWLIEQLVRIDFEILSVSYIISECFLLGLNLLIAENERQKALWIETNAEKAHTDSPSPTPEPEPVPTPQATVATEQLELFLAGISKLTPKEHQLYECYVSGMPTAQIMEELSIKENTLKFHSKNLYSKLGVSSRKQLTEMHKLCAAHQDAAP